MDRFWLTNFGRPFIFLAVRLKLPLLLIRGCKADSGRREGDGCVDRGQSIHAEPRAFDQPKIARRRAGSRVTSGGAGGLQAALRDDHDLP